MCNLCLCTYVRTHSLTLRTMEDISRGLEPMPILCEPDYKSARGIFPRPFRYVTRNIPGPGSDEEAFQDQLCGCDCIHDCDDQTCPCLKRYGPNYHPKTGRLLPEAVQSSHQKPILECNSECACNNRCSNRLVQQGPGARLKVAPAGARGFGLFACEDVERLTFVCEYAGEVVGAGEARKRLDRKEGGMNYLIVLREHCSGGMILTCVDPRLTGNVGRFANHSCDPNLLMVPVRVENSVPRLALFARRDISAGDELTFDYSGETVLSDSASASVFNSASVRNSSERKAGSETAGEKRLGQTVEENSHVEEQGNETALQKSLDQTKVSKTCMKDEELPEVNNETAKTGATDESCENDNAAEKESCARDSKVCSPNRQKRKRSESAERFNLVEGSKTPLGASQAMQMSLLDTEKYLPDQKVCYCGSACCKGFLPFEHSIFDS
ncbi:hypothetical protein V1264_020258 [Littorina saxatilis]|uniref:Uncharacterized protein n=2 Tax=Littorina saxatilis TaxID=31220 RepID=A0AAN9GBB6_9CAEN